MLKDAIKAGHKAKYVLFDIWFATPKGITAIKKKLSLDVLAMLKKSSKVFYEYENKQLDNKQLDLKKIYAIKTVLWTGIRCRWTCFRLPARCIHAFPLRTYF